MGADSCTAEELRAMGHTVDGLDPYHYARNHDAGPGRWCVRGPNNFEMALDALTKDQAWCIGKVLSGRWSDIRAALVDDQSLTG